MLNRSLLAPVFCLFAILHPLAVDAQKPELFVLAIGVEQYRDTRLNLNFCADDAHDMAEAWRRQTTLYRIGGITVLTDKQATRQAIRQELDKLNRQVTSDDLLVFIFSGHGIEDRLVPHDFNLNDREATSLGKDDLLEKINRLGCGYLLFIDACHSGSFAKSIGGKDITIAAANDNTRALVDALGSTDKPYLVFGSSASDQLSFECTPCGNGYFAQTFLDALDNKPVADGRRNFLPDADADGLISPYELDQYLKEAVRVRTLGEPSPQKVYSRLTMGRSFPLLALPAFVTPSLPTEVHENHVAAPIQTEAIQPVTVATDVDLDNIPDYQDRCPGEAGSIAFNGCPEEKGPAPVKTPDIQAGSMVQIRGGVYPMGASDGDPDERPVHLVQVNDFYLGQYEVTQVQWRNVMGSLPEGIAICDQCPVSQVSWDDVQLFIQTLNRETGRQYRLPTEAEWEFAGRGGRRDTHKKYAGSDDAPAVAWHSSNAEGQLHPVGSKKPNELGIYDLSGNAREWCADRYQRDYYEKSPTDNPTGPGNGLTRVCRGGSIRNLANYCRIGDRNFLPQDSRDATVGFRLALEKL